MSTVPTVLPAAGRLLVATPALVDPNFARSVVLLLDHDESGTLGVVLNRPTELDVEEVLPAWRPHLTGVPVVFQGGPVALDSALGLAAVPGAPDAEEPLGFRRVAGSLGLVDLDAPPEILAPELVGLRIFAGYSGWGPDQLDAELAEGSWYVVDALPLDAFTASPDGLWSAVLRRAAGGARLRGDVPRRPLAELSIGRRRDRRLRGSRPYTPRHAPLGDDHPAAEPPGGPRPVRWHPGRGTDRPGARRR